MSTEIAIAILFGLVLLGGAGGWLWLRRHPDAD
jgi:LPXTG-motif cell wall-anchored protein